MFTFPENCKVVVGQPPTTTNAAITGDYVSMKNVHKAWVVFVFKQAVSHQTVCSIYEDDDVAGSTGAAVTATMPVWYNNDISTNDTLTRGTDAATVTLAAGTTDQYVIMEVDPGILTAGDDCIAGHTTASSQSTDFVTILYVLEERYPSATPPTAITD